MRGLADRMNYQFSQQNIRSKNKRYAGAALAGLAAIGKMTGSTRRINSGFNPVRNSTRAQQFNSTKFVERVKAVGGAAPLKGRRQYSKKVKKGGKLSSIQRQLKILKQNDDATLGTMVYRDLKVGRLVHLQNVQNSIITGGFSTVDIEAAMAQLKFFNPAVPGTLTTANMSGIAFQNNVLIKAQTSKLLLRNNYQSDTHLKVYLCMCKDDTSQSPIDAWTASIPDGGNASGKDQINQFPTDYDLFNDLWRTKVVIDSVLSPGESISTSHTVNDVEYSTSTVDTHNTTYQSEYKNFQYLIVINGTIGHDSTVGSEEGYLPSGIDYSVHNTTKITYSAGVNISYIYLADTVDNFSNGGVQSHQPVPNNVGYSAA
ncbi:MAG: putative capsid protein [Circular genetic element sp.]|nr:MAG: putative capsid protein [Circular genetic element sp.]